jgi:hypothetical protein
MTTESAGPGFPVARGGIKTCEVPYVANSFSSLIGNSRTRIPVA